VLERGAWREIRRWDGYSFASVIALDRAAGIAVMHSDIGRDTLSVVRVALGDSRKEVFEDPRVDLTLTHGKINGVRSTLPLAGRPAEAPMVMLI